MSHTTETPSAADILAAVSREVRSYTDPRAGYPIARIARDCRLFGATTRRRAV